MAEEYLTMSHREVDRLAVIQRVMDKKLKQHEAAAQLALTTRQIKRLVRRYRDIGAAGLISRRRGKPPNNAIPTETQTQILTLVRTHYLDFGPTFACEKLQTRHGYRLSAETLRQWMIDDGIWEPKSRRSPQVHQRRLRRARLGELIQIDGSPHDWFESRGPYCTLLVFIDDATSCLLALRFVTAETTRGYMQTLGDYLEAHGRPVAIYSDRHSIFRVNRRDGEGELTQFSRALATLDIAAIHANTPQAKGRVERANQTLQDRLVKELRLAGISDMETANAFLPTFIAEYNARFGVTPRHPEDAHRPVLHTPAEVDWVLSRQHTRKLSKNLCFQFRHREYQIQGKGRGYRLRGAAVTLCEALDGTITVLHEGSPLTWKILAEGEVAMPLEDEKSVRQHVEQVVKEQQTRPKYKPAPDHPWKRSIVNNAKTVSP